MVLQRVEPAVPVAGQRGQELLRHLHRRGAQPVAHPASLARLGPPVDRPTRETVGNAAVLGQAYAATRRGGTTVTVGLPHPSKQLSIPAVSLVAEERTLKGSYLGSCVPGRDLPRFFELHREGRLPVESLLTHRLTLDEVNEGFDRLAAGHAVRQAVVF